MSKEKADIIKASDIVPKAIKWLWYPYIPDGKLTLVQGDPGDGKSKFVLAIAALLTMGMPLPFREEWNEPINVIYQTTGDDSDDTVVPRFINAGGDTTRLLFINEKDKALTFDDERIEDAIKETGAKLVILDPLSSYLFEKQWESITGSCDELLYLSGNEQSFQKTSRSCALKELYGVFSQKEIHKDLPL